MRRATSARACDWWVRGPKREAARARLSCSCAGANDCTLSELTHSYVAASLFGHASPCDGVWYAAVAVGTLRSAELRGEYRSTREYVRVAARGVRFLSLAGMAMSMSRWS